MARGTDRIGTGGCTARGAASFRRAAFRRGFRSLSPLLLVVAMALAALSFLGLELLVRAEVFTKVPEGRFVRWRNDDNGHVTYVLAGLREAPPRGPMMYLTGGSATMECFLDEESLGREISARAGEDIRLVSLAAHSQSFAESVALVENLPSGRAMIAVGLAPMRFTHSPGDDAGLLEGEPFLLRSSRVRRLLEQQSVDTPPLDTVFRGALRYVEAYVRERQADGLPILADIGYEQHYTIDGPLRTAAQKLAMAERDIAEDRARYALYADYDFAVLEELVRLAQERGFTVVFFDQPLNRHVLGPSWAGLVPSYRRRATAIARAYGVLYLDVSQRVTLEDSDFLDVYHLVVDGRVKWQPEFARQLARAWTNADEGIAAR